MTSARRWRLNAHRLPAWRLRRFRPALFAAIPTPQPTTPAYVVRPKLLPVCLTRCPAPTAAPLPGYETLFLTSLLLYFYFGLKSPNLPKPCHPHPNTARSSACPPPWCDSSHPGGPGRPAHPLRP